jgi:anti-anti-sigma regulatory factor
VQPQRHMAAPRMLGLSTREEFREEAAELLAQLPVGSGELVIDFSETREVDSAGLGALVLIERHARSSSRSVALRGLSDQIRYTLTLTQLDGLFRIE